MKDSNFVLAFLFGFMGMTVCYIYTLYLYEGFKQEAVIRGYAEWYSETPGHIPDEWRWKQ